MQLTPVDLGPVEVTVTVRDSQPSIHFGAAQAETRALLEASIPKLREMLAAQGFNLMDASVSQGFSGQSRSEVPATSRSRRRGPGPGRARSRPPDRPSACSDTLSRNLYNYVLLVPTRGP